MSEERHPTQTLAAATVSLLTIYAGRPLATPPTVTDHHTPAQVPDTTVHAQHPIVVSVTDMAASPADDERAAQPAPADTVPAAEHLRPTRTLDPGTTFKPPPRGPARSSTMTPGPPPVTPSGVGDPVKAANLLTRLGLLDPEPPKP